MKKTALISILILFGSLSYSQQPYSIKITRNNSITGIATPLKIFCQGEEAANLNRNSSETLTGIFPSDSVIELGFKIPMHRPTKFFLYPNGTYDFKLMTNVILSGIKIRDLTVYPSGEAGATAGSKGVLPESVTISMKKPSIRYVHEKTLPSEEIRKQWARQGGKLTGSSLTYSATFLTMSRPPMKMVGGGAGWYYTRNFYDLKIPEYQTGTTKWNSFIYGMGASVNLNMAKVVVESEPPAEDFENVSGSLNIMITGNIGYTFGFGKFKSETEYKGFAIDLTYKPSIVSSVSQGGSASSFNYLGFGIDVNRTGFSAFANRVAPKAKSKFSFMVLPPVKDMPFMVTAGYGLVWYR